jgi:hypothetical protein
VNVLTGCRFPFPSSLAALPADHDLNRPAFIEILSLTRAISSFTSADDSVLVAAGRRLGRSVGIRYRSLSRGNVADASIVPPFEVTNLIPGCRR